VTAITMLPSWEMTRGEFSAAVLAGRRDFPLLGDKEMASKLARMVHWAKDSGQNIDIAQELFEKAVCRRHEADVLIAYSDGWPVPNRVLREYADRFTDEVRDKILTGKEGR